MSEKTQNIKITNEKVFPKQIKDIKNKINIMNNSISINFETLMK